MKKGKLEKLEEVHKYGCSNPFKHCGSLCDVFHLFLGCKEKLQITVIFKSSLKGHWAPDRSKYCVFQKDCTFFMILCRPRAWWGHVGKKISLYRCSHVCILSFLSFWEKLPDSHLSELFSSLALSWLNLSALITITCKGWTLCEYRLLEAGWSTHVASTCTAFTWCSCWIMPVTNLFFTVTG